jgi:hypothetical protein
MFKYNAVMQMLIILITPIISITLYFFLSFFVAFNALVS